jgi:DNA modification methylase
LFRVTKEWGVVVWVVWDATIKWSETGTSFRQALFFKEIWFNLHDTMIYNKVNTPPLNHNRYEQKFEYMFIFSKWKIVKFNPILESCKYAWNIKWWTHRNWWSDILQDAHWKWKLIKDYKIKWNIFEYSVWWFKWFTHPAVFPEKLAEDHILSWSNEWDTILDPFAWSFTTAKMAELNNRKWIMIEKEQEYFDIGINRLNSLKP